MIGTDMPYWPAAMNRKMAAAYCGICVDTFDTVCPVKPLRYTDSARGERYLRHQPGGEALAGRRRRVHHREVTVRADRRTEGNVEVQPRRHLSSLAGDKPHDPAASPPRSPWPFVRPPAARPQTG